MERSHTKRRALKVIAIFATVAALVSMPLTAQAYEAPTFAPTINSSSSATLTMPGSALATTVTTTGAESVTGASTVSSRSFQTSDWTPSSLPATTTAVGLQTVSSTSGCDKLNGATCASSAGTITLNFSQPVRNPILQLTGIGAAAAVEVTSGNNPGITAQSQFTTVLNLTTPGVTLSKLSGSNLGVAGSTISTTNPDAGVSCTTTSMGQTPSGNNYFNSAAAAGCGSVQVTGTVSTLTFNTSLYAVKTGAAPAVYVSSANTSPVTPTDGWALSVTAPQDFGDAPASYEQGNAARAVLSDVTLGPTVTEDNANVPNGTVSPLSSSTASTDVGDDGVNPASLTMLTTDTRFSTTVAISGASKAGTVCGYIDFTKAGTFAAPIDQACTTFAAGQTSATLTWTGIPTLSAASTFARFRIGYTANQIKQPTGASDSGEIEDYPFTIAQASPSLTVTKTSTTTSVTSVGQQIPYSFVVLNTGNVPLIGVSISDVVTPPSLASDLSAITCSATTLTPGSGTPCTGTYTVTQADIDNGSVGDTATAKGTPPNSAAISSTPSALSIPVTQSSKITLVKTADSTGLTTPPKAGNPITYSFTATNTGNTTLTGVAITDPHIGLSALNYTWPGTAGTLLPGQSVTATASYALTQADIDAGVVNNTAATQGNPPTGPPVTGSASASVKITNSPALSITKSANTSALSSPPKAGNVITYSMTTTNTGNTTMTGVSINDTLAGLSALSYAWPGTAGTLLPGQSVTATATYSITQADIDAGHVANTASTTGTPPTGPAVTPPSSSTDTPLVASPQIVLVKSANASALGNPAKAGNIINYTFTSTNTGNVTLTGVSITDPHAGLSALSYNWPGTAGTLLPGQTVTATASYTLTQADIDAGVVNNTAKTSGTSPTGAAVTSTSSATVKPVVAPGLAFSKTANASAVANPAAVGNTINYTLTTTNTGNVTMTGVSMNDQLAGISALSYTWPGTPGTLLPGQSVTATASYAITQADIDAGHVANTATTTGRTPSGPAVTPPGSSTDTPLVSNPAINLVKSADSSALATPAKVGNTITYKFVSTNTGNVTLTGVTIKDPHTGLSALTYTWPGTAGTLLPGQSVTATASYAVTQADIDAGVVNNTATTSGTPPTGTAVTGTASATVKPVTAPALTFAKSANAAGVSNPAVVGNKISYTLTTSNTGNVTMTGVVINDPLAGISALTYSWPGTAGTLLPGQSVTATATYSITQADINAGHVANTATTTGTTPSGSSVTPPGSSTDTPLASNATISLVKTADATAVANPAKVGNVVTYNFSSTNTGNVTLTGVTIADPHTGLSTLSYTWPGTAGTLLPGQTVTAKATYALTQADIDAGIVNNTATATGTPPTGAAATATSSAVVNPVGAPALTFSKSANASAIASPAVVGNKIAYTFTTTNTGNVTMTGVVINDPLAGISALSYSWPGTAGTLLPGQSVTATATYSITQADINAGHVANTATTTGTTPSGSSVTPPASSTDTPLASNATISLAKTADTTAVANPAKVGNVVTYNFSSTNTGNVTLTGVTIADPHTGLSTLSYTWPGTAGTLLPGQTVTAKATYALTQADIDAGIVNNTATATGTPPTGAAVTGTASATVKPTTAPALTFVKSANASAIATPAVVGNTITYTLTTTNTGNVTMTGVVINDPLAGISALTYSWPGTTGTLLPGQSVTATATYSITQADINAGHVANTATTTGNPPSGAAVTPKPSSTDTPLASNPAIALVKSADSSALATPAKVGNVVTYSFTSTNTGNVTLTGVTITDPHTGLSALNYTWPGTAGTLLPGESVTAKATYALTQADIDAGVVNNTATATGTPPIGAAVTSTSSAKVNPAAGPALSFSKSADSSAVANPAVVGNKITYNFSTTNTGNVTMTGVAINDPLQGLSGLSYTWPGTAGTLAPGQTVTASASYTVTQADINAGHVANTATTTGTPPSGPSVTPKPASTDTPLVTDAGISLSKTADSSALANPAQPGNVITYNFSSTNTGNVTLTGVTIADPHAGLSALQYTWPGTAGTLAPGQTVTATASYAITQGDIDAGTIKNTATATGTPPTGAPVTGTSSATVTPVVAPALMFLKTADASAVAKPAQVGNVITYNFTSTNSGNVTLKGVVINDPLAGLSAVSYTWPGTAGTLEPGQTVTATATYSITQADINAGHVANTATTTGNPPSGPAITPKPAATDTPLASNPSITLLKSADDSAVAQPAKVGNIISYTFTSTNNGNVTLTNVTIADPHTGLSALSYTWPGTAGTLLPGQTVTAKASYAITQGDIDAGVVNNTATAVGTPPSGPAVTGTSSATVTPVTAAAMTFVKTADASAVASPAKVGNTINYAFSSTNTGNVTLTGVTITDPLSGLSALTYSWPGTPGTLLPGQAVTATASYALTQADIDAGHVANTASNKGNPPSGTAVTPPDSSTDTPLVSNAAISLVKSADSSAVGNPAKVGDIVSYSFASTNTGNVTLTGVTITDPHAGLSALNYTWPGTTGTLAPGQSVTATASYAITQADINAGVVNNTASTSGTPPTGAAVSATSSAQVKPVSAPALSFVKSADDSAVTSPAKVGNVITYTFTTTNTGNVTMTGVNVTDRLTGLSALSYSWPGTAGTLEPGQSVSATATYAITQADINAGHVANTATGTGTPPSGPAVTPPSSSTDTPLVAAPSLSFLKSADSTGVASPAAVGNVINYTFTTTNTGNVTMTGVSITDPLKGLSALSYSWPGTAGTLAPGETVTASASYALTQADIDAGHVANTATSTGTPPSGPAITPPDSSTDTPLTGNAAITLTKSADATALTNPAKVGDVITYHFSSTNSGNVTLTQVGITDPHTGLSALSYTWPGTAGTLAPGQTVTATATYAITQGDIDAGMVNNTATAAGTPPGGTLVSAQASASATPVAAPAMTFSKSADSSAVSSPAAVGNVITYTFVSTNTGNVTIKGVTITDPLDGLSALTYSWPGTPGTLLPGQSATASATYALTQADIDAGHVGNTASSTGNPPSGPALTPPSSSTDTPLVANPALSFTKSADASAVASPAAVGNVITYNFSTTNTGNVTMKGVTITDPLSGLSGLSYTWPGAAGTLLPGQVVTATASYTLTQADIDAGHVANSATTTGTPPSGPSVTPPPESTDTTLVPNVALAFTKVADDSAVANPAAAGNVITYNFSTTNTGNVTMTGVSITDPLQGLSPLNYNWPGASGTLAPGQDVTARATYVLTQADVDAGHVGNTATTTGTPPKGPALTPPSESTDTPLVSRPAMTFTKAADSSAVANPAAVGNVITYTFTSSNTGNVTLKGVTISDPLAGLSALTYQWPGTPGELAPGQEVVATATYALTQADLDAGHVGNTATSTGNPPSGPALNPPPSSTDTTLESNPSMTFKKSADDSGVASPAAVGNVINYTFTSTNTGNVTLKGVTIADALPGLSALTYQWPGTPGELAPGQEVNASATYAVTQADINAGHVANTATSTGNPPSGPALNPPPSSTDTKLVANPAMTFNKSADSSGVANPAAVGNTIAYTFTATNTGNVTLADVSIADPLAGLSALSYSWPGTPGVLLPGQSTTASATYALTQADLDAGHVANTASSTATPPSGPAVTPPSSSTDTTLIPNAAMTFTKVADDSALSTPAKVGDVVSYTFTSTNTGNVTLKNVVINDPLDGLSALSYNWPGVAGTLAPGQAVVATATYALTQADINAGHVANSATSTGTPPSGPVVAPPTASTDTPITPSPAMTFTKVADGSQVSNPARVGQTISYTLTSTNTGNVTLTGVTINDPLTGLSALTYQWPGVVGMLMPGQSVTATATYQLTQADLNTGHVANSATSSANPPAGPALTPAPATTDTPLVSDPAMTFTKSADSSKISSPAKVGEVINYTLTAKNTGNVSLKDVSIADPMVGLSSLTYQWPGTVGELAPGQEVSATASYAITQADINAGHVENTATSSGTPPTGPAVTPPPASTDTAFVANPALTFSKVADASQVNNPAKVGNTVSYLFTTTNTGNVSMTGVSISDPLKGLSALNYSWPGRPGTLEPGQSVTATASYKLSQADIDSGHVANSATSTGNPPTGPAVTPPASSTDTPLVGKPALAFLKTADDSGIANPSAVGNQVVYHFTATNTGNVTLNGVTITDKMAGLSALSYQWPGTVGTLLPGQKVTATASYAITSADIAAKGISNTALATGTPPVGPAVTSPPSTATVSIPPGKLAYTGVQLTVLPLGVLLMLGGFLAIVTTRRKKRGI